MPRAHPDLNALADAALAHVEQHYPPPSRLRGRSLGQLHGRRLADLSAHFTNERETRSPVYLQDARSRAAYLLYYLPVGAATAQAALRLGGGVPDGDGPLRVLDVGAGPLSGTAAAALMATGRPIEALAIDRAPAIMDDGAAVLRTLYPDITITAKTADLRDKRSHHKLGEGHDLALIGNVLNEFPRGRERGFPQAVALVRAVLQRLVPGGKLVLFEPGTRAAFDRVLEVREALREEVDVHVVAPCLGSMRCPLAAQRRRDWCHAEQPWQRPALVEELDEAVGHRRTTLKFCYLVITNSAPAPARKGSWRIIGGPMRDRGAIRRYLCGLDGRAVARAWERELPHQHPLITAWRGDLAQLPGELKDVQRGKAIERTLDVSAQRKKPAPSKKVRARRKPPRRDHGK